MAEKTVEKLLTDYGYREVGNGLFEPARPSSERWRNVPGGWECFSPPTIPFGGGAPWGRPIDGGWIQVPFSQKESFKNAGGLHPLENPEAFEWIWPEERLREIYEHTSGKDGNHWIKTDEGKFERV